MKGQNVVGVTAKLNLSHMDLPVGSGISLQLFCNHFQRNVYCKDTYYTANLQNQCCRFFLLFLLIPQHCKSRHIVLKPTNNSSSVNMYMVIVRNSEVTAKKLVGCQCSKRQPQKAD
jgi:hypothetical protein